MSIPIQDTLGMLDDNLRSRHSVLPISRRKATAWAKGLALPRGGRVVLYTGQMFQLVPSINALSGQLSKAEGTWMARYFGFARRVNRIVNLAGWMARADPAEVKAYGESLREIALLLRAARVEFGYLYEDDLYVGALAYDEGLDATLREHAQHVYALLQAHGVEEVITVDPHTTHLLRTVYPTILPGFTLRVRTYLEVLAERNLAAVKDLATEVTIHDSCIYARREEVVEQPRELLRRGGVRIREAELSGRSTQCCGGPAEMLFPGRAHAVAAQRVEQLAKCSSRVVTLCPLCHANLRRAAPPGVEVTDISHYLTQAYCPRIAPLRAGPPVASEPVAAVAPT
jgi:Fe-S oxidoreductase